MSGGHSMATQAKQGLSRQRAQGASWPSSAWRVGGQITALRGTHGIAALCGASHSELSKAMRLSTLSLAQPSLAVNAGQSAATPSRAGAQSWARPRAQCFATLSASVPGAPRALQGDAGLPVQSSSVRCTGTHSSALHRLHSAPTPGAAVRLSTLCKAIHRALSVANRCSAPHAGTLSRAELRALNAALPGNAHGPKQSYAPQRAA